MCPGCDNEGEVMEIVETHIDIVIVYVLHHNFVNIKHVICLFLIIVSVTSAVWPCMTKFDIRVL